MSIFSKILSAIGIGTANAATTDSVADSDAPSAEVQQPTAISVVDVMAKMEQLAASSKEKLDWKHSIVDLMKLLGLESSFAVRKQLASELGCPSEFMGDSAKMNIWLHKTVLQKIADNGGNIPSDLLK